MFEIKDMLHEMKQNWVGYSQMGIEFENINNFVIEIDKY